ncbi:ElyC/SanA/YdcF family protein [Carnobacterium gallinarum]|uniref:ElyC/SanA/YdcF family protein n=1 Tax=Carnobacterium gallinarum TaxID=2749 RepID=UPI00068A9BC4|nr:ElyC/SanA/YdcF family protein [Carnobacterium gallinarum]
MQTKKDYLVRDCHDFTILSHYLACRDLSKLTKRSLYEACGIQQVDVILIAGNCLPITAKIAADAYHNGMAKGIFVAGGRGHTTDHLMQHIKKESAYQKIQLTRNQSEAEIFQKIICQIYHVPKNVLLIESKSMNGGENASESLKKFKEVGRIPKTGILIQDPTMQRRLAASFQKEWQGIKTKWMNYAPFIPRLQVKDQILTFQEDVSMGVHWEIEHYLSLLLGEIPRLIAYGPAGKNYIAEVDIPIEVVAAYQRLEKRYPQLIRTM